MSPRRISRDPLGAALDLVGDRWSLLIVRDLLQGRTRYGELRASVVGIASNVLADRLKRLEAAGVIERRWYTTAPPRAEYFLTPKGHGLGLAVGALLLWGKRHTDHELTIIDQACGHTVELVYRCPECQQQTPRSRLRIVEH